MYSRRKALMALACLTAGAAIGCGDSVDTSGNLSAAEEENNRKRTEAMEEYAKQQAAGKKKR
ncbi:hypothetical protein [Paludisphaera sp.]|uniref:hypothetical protein n=1 Tax=Paludisphaera sp. TaxID=2017432 RepID=UPI00301CEA07